jgi:serine transporter
MNDQANSVNERYLDATPTLSSWSQDTTWMLGLFGTAIGAGTCFCRSTRAWAASGRC